MKYILQIYSGGATVEFDRLSEDEKNVQARARARFHLAAAAYQFLTSKRDDVANCARTRMTSCAVQWGNAPWKRPRSLSYPR